LPHTPDFTPPDPSPSGNPPELDPAPTQPTEPSFSAPYIFFGREGLRAGWSLLLYFAILAALFACVGLIASKLHHPPAQTQQAKNQAAGAPAAIASEPIPLHLALLSEGGQFVIVAIATWIMARIERRPNSAFGFAQRRGLRNFLAGLAWGLAFLSLLVFTLRASGLLVFDTRLLFGRAILGHALAWFAAFLLVGLFEEYFTRGYLQFTIARGFSAIYSWLFKVKTPRAAAFGFWIAALLLSCAFGLNHKANPGESPIGELSAALIGLIFCLSLWRTGSLWWAIGFHAAWDWAQSFLYGVGDSGIFIEHRLFATHPVGRPILSGGLTGPEGSVYILAILALVTAVVLLTLPRASSAPVAAGQAQTRPPQVHLDLQ
jgi:membrane protease YdiL (CAAX protease family)